MNVALWKLFDHQQNFPFPCFEPQMQGNLESVENVVRILWKKIENLVEQFSSTIIGICKNTHEFWEDDCHFEIASDCLLHLEQLFEELKLRNFNEKPNELVEGKVHLNQNENYI